MARIEAKVREHTLSSGYVTSHRNITLIRVWSCVMPTDMWTMCTGDNVSEIRAAVINKGAMPCHVLLRFRGVQIGEKNGPETTSGRDWAARGSWEFWVPKSVRKS